MTWVYCGNDVTGGGNPSGLSPERKRGYLCPGKSNGTTILTEYAELCKNQHCGSADMKRGE